MQINEYILGIDTSNYTTSVALTNQQGEISADVRRLLTVSPGEKGLRQSDALFQHLKNLPLVIEEVMNAVPDSQIKAVAVSSRPRPVEGSYMPVFLAGDGFGRSIASALHVPFFQFSHQEGHIEAIKYYSNFNNEEKLLCFHLSGGTTELIRMKDQQYEIIGGTKDISLGQLIDRVGVAMGLNFPAGKELDQRISQASVKKSSLLTPIKAQGCWFNLSGIETQSLRHLQEEGLAYELFEGIASLLIEITDNAMKETGIQKVIFAGGVSESLFIRKKLKTVFGADIAFGINNLSCDNAVGISLLGGKRLWP